MIEIYTDGSCLKNPGGPGGYAVVVVEDEEIVNILGGSSPDTTNNRMEIEAIICAYKNYGTLSRTNQPIVYSDSSYCVNTFTNWIFRWADNGWTKADGFPPENLDLMKEYYSIWEQGYFMDLRKVKGHVGIKFNEKADEVAKYNALNQPAQDLKN